MARRMHSNNTSRHFPQMSEKWVAMVIPPFISCWLRPRFAHRHIRTVLLLLYVSYYFLLRGHSVLTKETNRKWREREKRKVHALPLHFRVLGLTHYFQGPDTKQHEAQWILWSHIHMYEHGCEQKAEKEHGQEQKRKQRAGAWGNEDVSYTVQLDNGL